MTIPISAPAPSRGRIRTASFAGLALLSTALLYATALQQAPLHLCPRCMEAAQWSGIFQASPQNGKLRLEQINISLTEQGYGTPHADKSVDNKPLTMHGTVYSRGLGTHANSALAIRLNGSATSFQALVGIDDETNGKGLVDFEIIVDGRVAANSGLLHGGQAPVPISVNLARARQMLLLVKAGRSSIDFDHADWANAFFTLAPGAKSLPTAVPIPTEPPRMVIPPPNPHPAIHGAAITGATPGYPFRFLIPATGQKPLYYAAHHLPAGLTVNHVTGAITGRLPHKGVWHVELAVAGPRGHADRMLTIVGGWHKLALTPPMGWNSWNSWAGNVNQQRVEDAAKAMINSGLAAHGYQYVNIDDTWEGPRDKQGFITTNKKFPNMAALARSVHAMGLKLGIYSSPGPFTCAGYPASYRHELQDAQRYAQWGVDYLKYDWCSYGQKANGSGVEYFAKPYWIMRKSLDMVPRDILFSFCQYGMGDVWKWGARAGGNCWRDTGDINDSWGSLSGIINRQIGINQYNGPGHWNDPDMLVVGDVGWGNPHPSHLTPNEQIMHITMWCMFSAPLLIGCDMTHLNKFTLALLTNDEALAINQDPMGVTAHLVYQKGGAEVWERPLSDGTHAVALLNMGDMDQKVGATWAQLGLKGKLPVRDLWLHKNLGLKQYGVSFKVPIHGAVLLKIGKAR